ncbi:sensor histidine kinase [Amycolatopsis minnesotensis]|uniref:histidine kinase n=1 Tax=Amycolatopsis minnesotensis TaxID=337894 RepID=A0ABN2SPM9_9PSEU
MNLSWLPRGVHLIALDVAAAIVWFLVYLAFTVSATGDGQPAYDGPVWLGWLVAAAVAVPIGVRRIWPLAAIGVVVAGSAAAVYLQMIREPFLGIGFVLYLVALREPPRRSGLALGFAAAGSAAALFTGHYLAPGPLWADMSDIVGYMAAAWLVSFVGWGSGFAVRLRRQEQARIAERDAERALADERLRLARELHDVVAHSMSLIAVKAAVANHVAAQNPAEAVDALRVIEATSRDGLADLRRMLGVLRTGDTAELAPAPGPSSLAALAKRAEVGGVRVDLEMRDVTDLPEAIGLSVYRIVQESLTNVVKHAAPARCSVLVDGGGDTVRIEVTDNGTGARTPVEGAGHGLIGMRERALLYGGDLIAGPLPGGGFRVSATLSTTNGEPG